MQDALLTVVIPFYNAARTVLRAADSVLQQPCADRIELLLVDDGSSDQSGTICDQYAEKHAQTARVRVLHKVNGGGASARNSGIQAAQGRYVCFLDADDWWENGFFDPQLVRLLGEDFDLYNFSYQSVSPDLRWRKIYPLEDKEQRDLQPDCERPYYIRHWACIHRREHLLKNEIYYPLCKINEDVPFMHLSSALARSVKSCSKVMVNYWLNPKSCVHTSSSTVMIDEILKSLRMEEDMFRARGFEYSNDREMLSEIIRNLPMLCAQMSYGELRKHLNQPSFELLWQEEIKPWRDLCHQEAAFKKHPFLFWARSRLSSGLPMVTKQLLYRSAALMKCACFLRYRLLLRWDRQRQA